MRDKIIRQPEGQSHKWEGKSYKTALGTKHCEGQSYKTARGAKHCEGKIHKAVSINLNF